MLVTHTQSGTQNYLGLKQPEFERPRQVIHTRVQTQGIRTREERSGAIDVKKLNRDKILTSVAIAILLFTAMINWNIYSWLVLLAMIVILAAWYSRKQQ